MSQTSQGPAANGARQQSQQHVQGAANTATAANAQLNHPTRPIDGIIVGDRFRRDLGDLVPLAASMDELGLLQPIVIRPDGTLIAGERRLRAAKALDWPDIPVTVVDLDAVVRGEFAENAIRKDFTLSEAVAIKRALEPLERAAARERMASPEKFFNDGAIRPIARQR